MQHQRVLVIPDTHVPFHDTLSWKLVLNVISDWEPDLVVFIGDFGDNYAVSDHSKDPARKDLLADEVAKVNAELDRVQELVDSKAVFIEGNHEDRLRRYLWDKAPKLLGACDIDTLYRIRARGWKHVPYRDLHQIGNVTYTHDLGRSGANAARQSLLDLGGNLVFGHTHRGAVVYQGEVKGSAHFALNVGWLGNVEQIDYMHKARAKRDWQLGFGTVIHAGPKRAFARFHPIVSGRAEVDGTLYE